MKQKVKYRTPFRVYVTSGFQRYGEPKVVESLDAVARAGRGLYNYSEDSWYAEDANGVLVEESDIPRVGGYYESTDGYGEGHLFCGYHWGGRLPRKPFRVMWSGCTGPAMGLIPQDATSVGFGSTMPKAIESSRKGKRAAKAADSKYKKNWKDPLVVFG